jgi:tRNA1Val (adenine37-N6)-methyltransferase
MGGSDPRPALDIRQPSRGYRFSIDSVLLAGFAAEACRGAVLDLGTGCGVLLLLLSRLSRGMDSGTGVELQEVLLRFARENFRRNGPEGRLHAVAGDFRGDVAGVPRGAFDLVVSNPPFGRAGHGRRNPDAGRETARHDVSCSLAELFAAARSFMAPGGRFALIFPARRFSEIEACARREEMGAAVVRWVHPRAMAPANRVLYCASRCREGPSRELPPLHVHGEQEKYAPEVERICRLFRVGRQERPG